MQRVVDIIDRDAQRLRFTLVDIDLQLRAVIKAVVAHAGELWTLSCQLQQLIARGHQRIVPGTAVILKLHIEAGRAAQTADSRRAAGVNPRFFDFVQRLGGALDNGKRGASGAIALVPVFQAHKHARDVLPITTRAGTDGGKNGGDIVLLVFEEIVFNLFHHFQRLLLSGATRQLDRSREHAAIFQRQERGGQAQEQKYHAAQQYHINQHPAYAAMEDFRHAGLIAARAGIEVTVEPAKEAFGAVHFAFMNGFENGGAQRGRQNHRHQYR